MDAHEERALRYRRKTDELRAMLGNLKDKQTRGTVEPLAADDAYPAMI